MPLPATALTHPTTRRAIVSALLQAAACALPGRSGYAIAHRADGQALLTIRAYYRGPCGRFPAGVSFAAFRGNAGITNEVLAALGPDLGCWVSTLADSLASPSTTKVW